MPTIKQYHHYILPTYILIIFDVNSLLYSQNNFHAHNETLDFRNMNTLQIVKSILMNKTNYVIYISIHNAQTICWSDKIIEKHCTSWTRR